MADLATIGFKANTSGLLRAEKSLDSLAKKGEYSEKRINKSVNNVNQSFSSLRTNIGLAGAALTALGSARLTTELISQTDAWKNINSQIRQVTKSEEQLVSVQKQLVDLSRDTRSDLTNTVDLYATLTRSTKDLGTSQAEILSITKTLNNLFVSGGKPISEVSGAIRQLSQGFAAGALRGDEFNSVAEGAPKIMDALSVALKMSRGELREFAATGGITAEIMIDALKDYSDVAQGLADQTTKTFGQSMEIAGTNITQFVGESEKLNAVVDTIGETVEDITGELGFFSEQLGLWTGQFDGWADDAQSAMTETNSVFERQFLALGSIVDETMKLMGGAIINFPSNIRAMTKILAVELAFAVDAAKEAAINFGSVIGISLANLSQLPKIYVSAFVDLVVNEFDTLIEKAKIIGLQLKDALNPFDGDAFDFTDAYDEITNNSTAATNKILAGVEKQKAANKTLRDEMVADVMATSNARIAASKAARESTIIDIIAQRDATLSAYDAMEKGAKEAEVTDGSSIDKKAKIDGDALKSLTKEIDNFGGAWTRTGNAVVDAFGTMADAMDDHMARMSSIDKLQEKINEKRKDATVDQIELERLQMNLNFEKDKAEIAGMASISNHLGSLFDEKTAAAKSFAALSQVLAVAEIALSYQKMAASTAETGVIVANGQIQQSSNALTAITAAFAAPFPVGFVAGAAMIGIMAALVGSAASSGSFIDPTEERQASQGTGTLLGSDDKSSSLIDLQERFEDIQIDQLAELRGIKDGLTAIDNGIDLVTRNFIAGDFGSGSQFEGSSLDARGVREGKLLKLISGEFFGGTSEALVSAIFGKTTKEVTDSGIQFLAASLGDIIDGGITAAEAYFDITTTKKKLFGLVKNVNTSTETQGLGLDFENQITAIFQNIGSTVSEAATLLGFDVTEAINNFTVDLGKISLEGLTGEEISAELSAVFGAAADDIASAAIPALSQYQEIGEGAFETLVRVAQEQAVFNDSIERLGFNLSELSNVMQIDIAQSLIGLTGGFENFSDLTNSFFDNFFSDSEQLAVLEASLSDVFNSLGFSLVTSREEFKNLISGIDITTDEGQRLLATLLEVNPALSEYIDELERIESKRASLTIELLELQGKSEEALAMQRAIELEALDDSLKALQLLIYAEEDRALLLQTQEDAITSAMSDLESAIDLEKDRLQAVLDVAATARDVELERLDALRVALNAEKDLRQSALDDAQTAMEASFNNEISLVQQLANERIQALTDERTEIASTASAMSSLVDKINGSLGLDGSTDLIGALASARAGDFSKAQNLDVSGLSNLGSSGFTSASDMRIQQAINQNRLAEIGGLAGGKLSESEQLIASLDAQILATQEIADNEIEKLNNQLDSLLGIDSGILELNDSISAYQDAKMELDSLNYEAELAKLDMLVESANEVYNLHEENYNTEISRLDSILSTNLQLVNAAFNINDSILSVSNAIIGLQESFAENAAYQREIVKNTQTTAAASKDAKLNGQDVRIVS